MRVLLATAAFFALAGIASAAAPQPTTIVHTPAPVKALAQDGGLLAWLGGDGKKCNSVHVTGNGNPYVLPQPPNAGMTCHWALSSGTVHLALAAGASAALWTLHESRTDFVMTAQAGGKEIEVDRLAHARRHGIVAGQHRGRREHPRVLVGRCRVRRSARLRLRWIVQEEDRRRRDRPRHGGAEDGAPKGCTCARHRGLERPHRVHPGDDGREERIPGRPASVPRSRVVDVSNGTVVSQAKPVGVPLAIGLSSHVLAILSRNVHFLRLSWYDPATGRKLGGIGVPVQTAPALAVNDQNVIFRFGRNLRALVLAKRHVHPLGKTAASYLGLSLDNGRLVWAENHQDVRRHPRAGHPLSPF